MNRKRLTHKKKEANRAQRKATAANKNTFTKATHAFIITRLAHKVLGSDRILDEFACADAFRKDRIITQLKARNMEMLKEIKKLQSDLELSTDELEKHFDPKVNHQLLQQKPTQNKQTPISTNTKPIQCDDDLPW